MTRVRAQDRRAPQRLFGSLNPIRKPAGRISAPAVLMACYLTVAPVDGQAVPRDGVNHDACDAALIDRFARGDPLTPDELGKATGLGPPGAVGPEAVLQIEDDLGCRHFVLYSMAGADQPGATFEPSLEQRSALDAVPDPVFGYVPPIAAIPGLSVEALNQLADSLKGSTVLVPGTELLARITGPINTETRDVDGEWQRKIVVAAIAVGPDLKVYDVKLIYDPTTATYDRYTEQPRTPPTPVASPPKASHESA